MGAVLLWLPCFGCRRRSRFPPRASPTATPPGRHRRRPEQGAAAAAARLRPMPCSPKRFGGRPARGAPKPARRSPRAGLAAKTCKRLCLLPGPQRGPGGESEKLRIARGWRMSLADSLRLAPVPTPADPAVAPTADIATSPAAADRPAAPLPPLAAVPPQPPCSVPRSPCAIACSPSSRWPPYRRDPPPVRPYSRSPGAFVPHGRPHVPLRRCPPCRHHRPPPCSPRPALIGGGWAAVAGRRRRRP